MARKKYPTPKLADVYPADRMEELSKVAHGAVDRFAGTIDELEKAIGVLMLGDFVGWKVLVLVHSKNTIKKYERILDINVREFFEEEGPIALRSSGYSMAKSLNKFWKVVSGDEPVEDRRGFRPTD